jgi:carbamoyltransferase
MKLLGISAFYHDAAAALIVDGEIIAAAQEERFTQKKHDASFPSNAIQYCLDEQMITADQIDAIVFYDKPLLKFERLLETYYAFSPKGILSFIKAIPIWIKEKMFLKGILKKELVKIGFPENALLLFTEHHLSHAASNVHLTSENTIKNDGNPDESVQEIWANRMGESIMAVGQMD